ncbi:MAG: FAD-dependent oxidoreductase [Woeseiaceae bacterium]|nr:FAD-dependent oxidoreductase [Woeseiaceae bacterium]
MEERRRVDVAIVGAGIAGIATAYYACAAGRRPSVLLVDPRPPMSFTSARSGDNFRNWWPHPAMTAFTNHSIDLLETIAAEAPDAVGLRRRGYLLATRRADIDDLLADLQAGYGESPADAIRIHERAAGSYLQSGATGPRPAPRGVDVLSSPALVAAAWPALAPGIRHLLHIRRAGELDGASLGAWMLKRVRAAGGRQLRGRCRAVTGHSPFTLEVETDDGTASVTADAVVNAAGPFAGEVAAMLDVELPVESVFQQKIAFEDTKTAVPRDLPFLVDLDPVTLDWPAEVRDELLADPALARWANEIKRPKVKIHTAVSKKYLFSLIMEQSILVCKNTH